MCLTKCFQSGFSGFVFEYLESIEDFFFLWGVKLLKKAYRDSESLDASNPLCAFFKKTMSQHCQYFVCFQMI